MLNAAAAAVRGAMPEPRRVEALRRGSDFRTVVRDGIRLSGKRMVLYVLASEQGVRVGFAVGRAAGGAVRRNRVRRQLKEAWRTLEPRVRQACDVVIVARPSTEGLRTQELRTEMEELLASFGALG
jgi:ribonuclease P protein component